MTNSLHYPEAHIEASDADRRGALGCLRSDTKSATTPAGFLAGEVNGGAITVGNATLQNSRALFDQPIAVDPSGTAFTIPATPDVKLFAGGTPIGAPPSVHDYWRIVPDIPATGTIYPGIGMWQLDVTSTGPYGVFYLHLEGQVTNP